MLYKKTLKPYVINSFYTWAIDLGFTPLIEVKNPHKKSNNKIPEHLLSQDSIVFNIHPSAIRNLVFGKEHIEFQANFNNDNNKESIEQIIINHTSITKIFNREDKYGLYFDLEAESKDLKPKPHLSIIKNNE